MTSTNNLFERLAGTWENRVDGAWQDTWGWNIITQPQLGDAGDDDFRVRVDQMRERVTFRPLDGFARNVGVTGEAGFWRAMTYEVDISTPSGSGIHHEVGHFLLRVQEDGETPQELEGVVIRQATIPRANAMMTTGVLRPGSVRDAALGFYSAHPTTSDVDLQGRIDAAFEAVQAEIGGHGGPNLCEPVAWLRTILSENVVGVDWEFGFRDDDEPSQMANGQRVVNPVLIGNLLSDFWIARRQHGNGEIEILQYAQTVPLIFNLMRWPHVALNTLVKQA